MLKTIFVFALFVTITHAQVYVEDYRNKTIDGKLLKSDDDIVAHAYKIAKDKAVAKNKTETLYFEERVYHFHKKTGNVHLKFHAAVWPASLGKGRRSSRFVFHNIKSNEILILCSNGYGGGISGIDIRTASYPDAKNVTALHLESVSSFTVDQIDMTLHTTLKAPTNGIVIARKSGVILNTESLTVSNINIRAKHPISVLSGDNITIENADLRCWNGLAPIRGQACDNLVIKSVTGQGGMHAIHFQQNKRVHSGLTIKNYRFEQGTPHDGAIWVVRMARSNGRHGLEFFNMEGCRSGPYTSYAYDFDGILRTTISGGFTFGGHKPK